ncbi:Uncharacterised protein [uncultured archaeon]|nr:Uncharacterised protein [uncultured archaeon]
MGKVTGDSNGAFRILTVKFEDGTQEEIRMSNLGPDPEEVHEYEWLCGKFHGANGVEEKWLRF